MSDYDIMRDYDGDLAWEPEPKEAEVATVKLSDEQAEVLAAAVEGRVTFSATERVWRAPCRYGIRPATIKVLCSRGLAVVAGQRLDATSAGREWVARNRAAAAA